MSCIYNLQVQTRACPREESLVVRGNPDSIVITSISSWTVQATQQDRRNERDFSNSQRMVFWLTDVGSNKWLQPPVAVVHNCRWVNRYVSLPKTNKIICRQIIISPLEISVYLLDKICYRICKTPYALNI